MCVPAQVLAEAVADEHQAARLRGEPPLSVQPKAVLRNEVAREQRRIEAGRRAARQLHSVLGLQKRCELT